MLFFYKQKTAYEMRISDWSSDVCSSDLAASTPYRGLCYDAMRDMALMLHPPHQVQQALVVAGAELPQRPHAALVDVRGRQFPRRCHDQEQKERPYQVHALLVEVVSLGACIRRGLPLRGTQPREHRGVGDVLGARGVQ